MQLSPISPRWLAVFALAVATLPHAAAENVLRIRVPFPFTVRATSLPAGEYSIVSRDPNGTMQVASADGRHNALALTHGTGRPAHTNSNLLFDCQSGTCKLDTVQLSGRMGRKVMH